MKHWSEQKSHAGIIKTTADGLRINRDFSTEGLAAQLPDTFSPYHVFGCETAAGEPFAGTIFRLPLRTAEQAASSRITKRAFAVAAARGVRNPPDYPSDEFDWQWTVRHGQLTQANEKC